MAKPYLRRYMMLRHAVELLRSGKLAFLDPATWDDTNDSHFLEAYKQQRKLKTLLAVCFTQVSERHHHWERFPARGGQRSAKPAKAEAADHETVCIEFDQAALLHSLRSQESISSGVVNYWRLTDLERKPPAPAQWPFIKRLPYQDEREFRIIFASRERTKAPARFAIDPASIRTVIVGPYVDTARREEIAGQLRALRRGPHAFEVNKTTILDNQRWKKIVDRAMEAAK